MNIYITLDCYCSDGFIDLIVENLPGIHWQNIKRNGLTRTIELIYTDDLKVNELFGLVQGFDFGVNYDFHNDTLELINNSIGVKI